MQPGSFSLVRTKFQDFSWYFSGLWSFYRSWYAVKLIALYPSLKPTNNNFPPVMKFPNNKKTAKHVCNII